MIPTGFVYFAHINGGGPIKIGHTHCVVRRMELLSRKGKGLAATALASLPGNRATEARFHRHYWQHHIGREWFEPSPRLLADIERINAGTFDLSETPEGPNPILSAAATEAWARKATFLKDRAA